MLLLLALGIGTLAGCGTWLLLRARTFDTVLGLTLLTYAVNLFIFTMGRVRVDAAPVLPTAVVLDGDGLIALETDRVPEGMEAEAREGAAACPAEAIVIEEIAA